MGVPIQCNPGDGWRDHSTSADLPSAIAYVAENTAVAVTGGPKWGWRIDPAYLQRLTLEDTAEEARARHVRAAERFAEDCRVLGRLAVRAETGSRLSDSDRTRLKWAASSVRRYIAECIG